MNHSRTPSLHAIAAALVILSTTVMAATQTVDGIKWKYMVDGGTALVGYLGSTAVPKSTSGPITIPSTLGSHPVTGILEFAFYGCTNLTSVTIPNSVTSIGTYAFYTCSALTNVMFGNNVTNIGYDAFNGCPLTSVTIPDSVTSIEDFAFCKCSALTNVTIGNSVTNIGSCAFSGCTNLTRVTIPDSVTSIGAWAFPDGLYDTKSFPGVCLVDGWAVGWTNWLSGALDLTGVRGIAGSAFSGCSGLTSVTIPDSVTSIGESAFWGCTNLTRITIPDSVTSIGVSSFRDCCRLTNVTLGNSVTSIGNGVFEMCSALTHMTIPDSVTNIGKYVFWGCINLTSVRIGNSVTSIEGEMFPYCDSLTTLYVPMSWKGTTMLDNAGIPSGCTVVYTGAPEAEVTSSGVPISWIDENATDILASNGGDHEAAATALAANFRPVWECYVAGLSTTNAAETFKIKSISFMDGEPVLEWKPDLNDGGQTNARTYTVQGRATMADDWDVPDASSRFFRVWVGMPKQ